MLRLFGAWPAIDKRRLPGFQALIDEYPNLTDTSPMNLTAKVRFSEHKNKNSFFFLSNASNFFFQAIMPYACLYTLKA